MHKFIVSLFAVSALGLGGAFAQVTTVDRDLDIGNQYWGGLSLGVPFGVNFHFGAEDMLSEGVDLRANLSAGLSPTSFGVGADVIFDLPVDTGTTPLDVYAGGGVSVAFGELALPAGSDTELALGLFAGVEYRLVEAGLPEGGVFAEVGPSIRFGPRSPFAPNVKLGFNYHF